MAIRGIRKLGDPVLRQSTEPIKRFNRELEAILEDMTETMEHYNGVGLAAPQVGLSLALVVIKPGEDFPVLEFVNPKILSASGQGKEIEGCLSCPGVFGEVERASEVTLAYQDRRGKRKSLNASGFLARIIQHELDHLAGTLFIDKASSFVSEGEGPCQE